jgi:FlaA1/EpsC-like NDP-sugar epimerase
MKYNKIVVTGGSGLLGNYLKKILPGAIYLSSKDYDLTNQNDVEKLFKDLSPDCVVHLAARVGGIFDNIHHPYEYFEQNILMNTLMVKYSKNNNVKKVIALSTDKASNPINLYGATKLASDKLFISANLNNNNQSTVFAVVRYGNVMGSRGSVIPFFLSLNKKEKFPITNPEMTRFMVSVEESLKMVFVALEKSIGGEIFIKKSPSIKITDLAKYINPYVKFRIIGERAGEKIHEQMIGFDESKFVYDFKDYFIIFPSIIDLTKFSKITRTGKRVKKGFVYTSDNNNLWLSPNEFRKWLSKFQYKN